MDTAHFQITASSIGGRIHVNGQDLSDKVAAADLRIGLAEPTVLSLHMVAGEDPNIVEGRGIVQVVAGGGDRVQLIEEFIAQVDPVELEQAALNLDGAGTLTQKMLGVLVDWANAPS